MLVCHVIKPVSMYRQTSLILMAKIKYAATAMENLVEEFEGREYHVNNAGEKTSQQQDNNT